MTHSKWMVGLVVLVAVASRGAWALNIEITGGQAGATPIAIVPFGWEGATAAPLDVAEIVTNDLTRSGLFSPLARKSLVALPSEGRQVDFPAWRVLGMPNLVVGKLRSSPTGYVVQFQVFDVFKGEQLAGYSIPADAAGLRRAAHQAADIVYQTLTGQSGGFDSRITFINQRRGDKGSWRYTLYVADADGYNAAPLLISPQPIMSPAWSPDGAKLAYVSFERGRAGVFVHEVATRRREMVSGFAGLNGAPAWSPDGTKLAMVLSKDGNPEIYVMTLKDKSLQRITDNQAIDTEPTWAPDGRSLVFTSDRSGRPQLYRVGLDGVKPQRLTFEGDYNARAAFSPDGKQVVFVHGDANKFSIAVLDIESGNTRSVSDGSLDESPSFAPNGAIILYSTVAANRGGLGSVSSDGRVHQMLPQPEGEARQPAWGPRRVATQP